MPKSRKDINRDHYLKHREKKIAYAKEWCRKNKEPRQEIYKRCIKKNKETTRARKRRHYAKHRDKILAQMKEQRARRGEPMKLRERIASHKRRALTRGDSFTKEEWLLLCEKYENKCLACGIHASETKEGKLTMDHVIPISPPFNGANLISNIQPLCKSCNSSKHQKTTDYRNIYEVVNVTPPLIATGMRCFVNSHAD